MFDAGVLMAQNNAGVQKQVVRDEPDNLSGRKGE